MQEFAPEPLNTCDLDRMFMLEGSPIKIEESPRPINDYIQTSKKVDQQPQGLIEEMKDAQEKTLNKSDNSSRMPSDRDHAQFVRARAGKLEANFQKRVFADSLKDNKPISAQLDIQNNDLVFQKSGQGAQTSIGTHHKKSAQSPFLTSLKRPRNTALQSGSSIISIENLAGKSAKRQRETLEAEG